MRSRQVRFKARELSDHGQPPNPARRVYPTWTPAPLPATRSADGLVVILTKLESGRVAPDGSARHWARVELQVRENGRPTDRWEPVGAVLSDATGNVLAPLAPLRSRVPGNALDSP